MSEAIEEVVRARRIEVVDGAGTARIVLTVVGDGTDTALLAVVDPVGRGRILLGVDAEGSVVELVEGGNSIIALSATRDGYGALTLFDEEAEPVKVINNSGAS
jgi:hypothetical protein